MNPLTTSSKKRIDSIDMLRGIIMIIMALDHTRDYFHAGAAAGDPANMATTTPIFFFTRWITHFCAPLFVFLSGAAAYLNGTKKSKKELSAFLFKRGISLLLIDLVLFDLLFTFDPLYHVQAVAVIWVTGWSMILLAAFVFLPMRVLLTVGLALVAGHNLLDRFNAPNIMAGNLFWGFLHQQHITPYAPGRMIFVLYPLIPWPGVMLLGYCMGSLFAHSVTPAVRRKYLVRIGLITTITFFVVRAINVYGDNIPWETQRSLDITVLSFFNVTKYPPSLLYLCMTIGPGLLMLAWLEKTKAKWTQYVVIYGRVPMFYYLLHLFILHFACAIVFFINGNKLSDAGTDMMWFRPKEFGYSLGVVYLIWIALVWLLYPLCKRYSKYKATHHQWWLSYL